MSIILKGILALFWLLLVPAAIGILVMSKRKDICPEACLPFGYLVLFSVMEIFTLPLAFLKAPLHILTALYGGVAVLLAAGLDGIKNKITPTKSSNLAMQGQQAEHLPSTLKEAIDYFEESTWVKDVLGEEFCKQYVAAKKNEWLRYIQQVTDWEIAEYLYRL